ncbi:hypothetical protein [Kangiella shandongensis]|uniref:hypothetical protein n=1 Tax=Kangiella shandongensis TaxID=2763258 RepID=UPI001CC15152|nr:hypothetical protein [Kangiella shandongensis]
MKYLILTLLLVTGFIASGAEKKQQPCSDDEYHQFDFWVGEWEVFNPKGKKVGENTIEKILNDCSLKESWRGVSGSVGHSFNIYDNSSQQWHQTWVDNRGSLLQLDGGLVKDAMVLQGVTQGRNGVVLNKITWTPVADNVRQVWQVSTDEGKTWKTIFNGLYKKASK